MTLLSIYFITALIVLYVEAMNCYRDKAKFDVVHELVFSILWVVTLPLAVYTVWKLSTEGYTK
jgi:hypothetical protein